MHSSPCSSPSNGHYRLTQKVRTPYTALQTHASRLQKLQTASDLLRRTSRFVILTRRLHVQMVDMSSPNKEDSASVVLEGEDEKERTIAKAALSIAELGGKFMSLAVETYMKLELQSRYLTHQRPAPTSQVSRFAQSRRSPLISPSSKNRVTR